MTAPFNDLTPAEAERLAMLAEEAGEVVQAVGKILRHGYISSHPDGGPTNYDQLVRELQDVITVAQIMHDAKDIRPLRRATDDDINRKLRYTHHQSREHPDVET